jgi:hypothetical protein
MIVRPLPATIDPPFPIRGGWPYLLDDRVLTSARSRVSSRPRKGIRKFDTRLGFGIHYNIISTIIPIRYIRAGMG